MKTADEILSKYWIDEYNKAGVRTGGHIIFQKDAVKAMEEYANARLQELILTDEQIDRESGKVFPYSDYEWNKVTELRKAFFEAAKWYRNKIQEKCKQ